MNKQLQAQQKLRALLSKPGGVTKLMSSLRGPLKQLRDYYSIARKLVHYDPLEAKEIPAYNIDPQAYAYQVPFQGAAPSRMIPNENKLVYVQMFDLNVHKEFPISFFQQARYNLPARLQQVLRNALNDAEDILIFKLLDAVIADTAYPHSGATPSGTTLTSTDLNDAFSLVDNQTDVASVVGRASAINPIRVFGNDIFSAARKEMLVKSGVIGTIWGAQVLKTRHGKANRLYIIGNPEDVGRMPEFLGPQPLKNVDVKGAKIEVGMFENVGLLVHAPVNVSHFDYTP